MTDPDPANSNSIAAFSKAGFRALETRDTPWGHVLLMRCDNSDPATASGARLVVPEVASKVKGNDQLLPPRDRLRARPLHRRPEGRQARGRHRAAQPLAAPAAARGPQGRGAAQEHPDDRADRLRQDRDLAPAGPARGRAVPQGGGHQVHRGRLCRPRRRFHRARPGRGRHRPHPRGQAQGSQGAGREERRGARARRPGRRQFLAGDARELPPAAARQSSSTTRRSRSRWPTPARNSRPSTSPAPRSA